MIASRKLIGLGVGVAVLLVLLGGEARYVLSQPLLSPGTVELGGLIQAAGTVKVDLVNCVIAGTQTGWLGYQDYVGFTQAGQQKLDAVARHAGLAVGSDVLGNCESVGMSFSTGKPGSFGELRILNRFNQIWFKIERY